jgi:hypothetical protein
MSIIRRSTTYGAPYDPNALSEKDDEVPRGVYFLFISAKAMATLEFLQGEWINDGNFAGVGDERDPMVGLQPDGRHIFDSAGTGPAPDTWHRDLQRPSRRRVSIHAEPVGIAVDRGTCLSPAAAVPARPMNEFELRQSTPPNWPTPLPWRRAQMTVQEAKVCGPPRLRHLPT